MAKIGVEYPCYATTGASPVSGVIGKAITVDLQATSNEVFLYADNAVAESDRSFQSCTISLDTSDLSQKNKLDLLGHKVVASTGAVTVDEIRYNQDDTSATVKFGFIARDIVDSVYRWRAVCCPKVQFSEPGDTNNTKSDQTAFGTHTMPGTAMPDDTGDWKIEAYFDEDKKDDALEWLRETVGLAATPPIPIP